MAAARPGAVPEDRGSRGRPPRCHRGWAGPYLGQVVLVPQVHPHSGPFCFPLRKGLVPLDPAAAGVTPSPPCLTEPPPTAHPQHRPGSSAAARRCQPWPGREEKGMQRSAGGLRWGRGVRGHILPLQPQPPAEMLREGAHCGHWLSCSLLGHQVPAAPGLRKWDLNAIPCWPLVIPQLHGCWVGTRHPPLWATDTWGCLFSPAVYQAAALAPMGTSGAAGRDAEGHPLCPCPLPRLPPSPLPNPGTAHGGQGPGPGAWGTPMTSQPRQSLTSPPAAAAGTPQTPRGPCRWAAWPPCHPWGAPWAAPPRAPESSSGRW